MKKKIACSVLTSLMVTTLLLTPCGPGTTEEEEVTTEVEAATEEGVVTEEEEAMMVERVTDKWELWAGGTQLLAEGKRARYFLTKSIESTGVGSTSFNIAR